MKILDYITDNFNVIHYGQFFEKSSFEPKFLNFKIETDKTFEQIKNILYEESINIIALSKIKNLWHLTIEYREENTNHSYINNLILQNLRYKFPKNKLELKNHFLTFDDKKIMEVNFKRSIEDYYDCKDELIEYITMKIKKKIKKNENLL